MIKFRDWMNEKEGKETEYQAFFKKKLEKFGVKSASELTGDDKKKFFDEVDAEWKSEDEKEDVQKADEKKECNEAKQIVDKKQLEWFIGLANKAKDLDTFIEDLNLMKGLVK